MKRTTIFVAITVALSVAAIQGCGDDTDTFPATTTTTTTTTGPGSGGSGGSGGTGGSDVVPPPAIGAQIDRFGRPAINTALNKTFATDAAMKGAAKDAWNQDANAAMWSATYGAEVAANLAILDSLDTVCGNQPLAAVVMPGDPIPADRYAGLAGALADDRLWVNTAGAACTTYLAVEANATGLLENMDCGGRMLPYDVIDASYSILAAGDLTGSIGDGIDGLPAEVGGEVFPYLADPH